MLRNFTKKFPQGVWVPDVKIRFHSLFLSLYPTESWNFFSGFFICGFPYISRITHLTTSTTDRPSNSINHSCACPQSPFLLQPSLFASWRIVWPVNFRLPYQIIPFGLLMLGPLHKLLFYWDTAWRSLPLCFFPHHSCAQCTQMPSVCNIVWGTNHHFNSLLLYKPTLQPSVPLHPSFSSTLTVFSCPFPSIVHNSKAYNMHAKVLEYDSPLLLQINSNTRV